MTTPARTSPHLGSLQLRIMPLLWEHGSSTVRDTMNTLNAQKEYPQLAYTTVLTVMRNLVNREYLTSKRGQSCHIFTATGTADEYKKAATSHLIDSVFAGDAQELLGYVEGAVRG